MLIVSSYNIKEWSSRTMPHAIVFLWVKILQLSVVSYDNSK